MSARQNIIHELVYNRYNFRSAAGANEQKPMPNSIYVYSVVDWHTRAGRDIAAQQHRRQANVSLNRQMIFDELVWEYMSYFVILRC